MAAGGASTPGGEGDATVTINGHTYGPEDGVVNIGGMVELSGRSSTPLTVGGADRMQTPSAVTPDLSVDGPLYSRYWGRSYATSQESFQYWYYAHNRSMGNLYAGGRVYAVNAYYSLCYNNGTRHSSTTLHSYATSNGATWSPDSQVRVLKVSDNPLAPSSCKTQWHRWATVIAASIY